MAPLLTPADIARELGVSARWVCARITAGELRAVQAIGRGSGYRVRREWLEAFLAGREVQTPEEHAAPVAGSDVRRRRVQVRKVGRSTAFASLREAREELLSPASPPSPAPAASNVVQLRGHRGAR